MSARATLKFFKYEHLAPNLQEPSKACAELARAMFDTLPQTEQLELGLQKLLEAKDCFVRAKLELQG